MNWLCWLFGHSWSETTFNFNVSRGIKVCRRCGRLEVLDNGEWVECTDEYLNKVKTFI